MASVAGGAKATNILKMIRDVPKSGRAPRTMGLGVVRAGGIANATEGHKLQSRVGQGPTRTTQRGHPAEGNYVREDLISRTGVKKLAPGLQAGL